MRRRATLGLALLGALALSVPAASARADGAAADPGVAARTITIGGTFPLSGPASLYATIPAAMKAYFSYINATRGPDGKRGVGGRQIVFKFYDDGYNPANAVQLTRRLVEEDKVFAVVGSLGTEVNLGIRPYLNARKVPHVLVSTGASIFSTGYRQYPWTTGWQPDYTREGKIFGKWIARNNPQGKVGVIYQNDDYGKELLDGLKAGLGSKQITAAEPLEVTAPDPRSQVGKLKAAGVDTLVIFLTPRATVQTYAFARALAFKPSAVYTNSVSATDSFLTAALANGADPEVVNGTITTQYAKDPASPSWNNDAAMKLYKQVMATYYPSGKVVDGLNYYGVATAHAFVQLLRKAGSTPTRAALMRAARNWNEINPFLLPNNRQKTSGTDQYAIDGRRLVRYQNNQFTPITELDFGQ